MAEALRTFHLQDDQLTELPARGVFWAPTVAR
jgi:hypothetical protein